jgi:hypothetical protein
VTLDQAAVVLLMPSHPQVPGSLAQREGHGRHGQAHLKPRTEHTPTTPPMASEPEAPPRERRSPICRAAQFTEGAPASTIHTYLANRLPRLGQGVPIRYRHCASSCNLAGHSRRADFSLSHCRPEPGLGVPHFH